MVLTLVTIETLVTSLGCHIQIYWKLIGLPLLPNFAIGPGSPACHDDWSLWMPSGIHDLAVDESFAYSLILCQMSSRAIKSNVLYFQKFWGMLLNSVRINLEAILFNKSLKQLQYKRKTWCLMKL